ncbi:MAG: hypothetical protein LIR46_00800 [Bacteroidota bacterium]|nr:hypothetical protein [Bacteroidota bacterium]
MTERHVEQGMVLFLTQMTQMAQIYHAEENDEKMICCRDIPRVCPHNAPSYHHQRYTHPREVQTIGRTYTGYVPTMILETGGMPIFAFHVSKPLI